MRMQYEVIRGHTHGKDIISSLICEYKQLSKQCAKWLVDLSFIFVTEVSFCFTNIV